MTWRALLALAAPPLAVSALLLALVELAQPPRPLRLAQPELNCTQPPTYRVGYQRESNGILLLDGGFSFQGLSWLETDLCTPGTLTVTADGEIAAPTLQIP